MTNAFRKAWDEMLRPLIQRPKQVQVAALCLRNIGETPEVLLVTSRGTGRWIVPKGWPIDGLDGAESALREAWEEAGVEDGDVGRDPVGRYTYRKGLDNGADLSVMTNVYRVEVRAMADDYPEASLRKRRWVSPERAANLVNEPELKDLLRAL